MLLSSNFYHLHNAFSKRFYQKRLTKEEQKQVAMELAVIVQQCTNEIWLQLGRSMPEKSRKKGFHDYLQRRQYSTKEVLFTHS